MGANRKPASDVLIGGKLARKPGETAPMTGSAGGAGEGRISGGSEDLVRVALDDFPPGSGVAPEDRLIGCPVDSGSVRLAEGASRRPRGVSLGPLLANPAAPDWAGALAAPAEGRQARPDLSRDKSGKKQAGR